MDDRAYGETLQDCLERSRRLASSLDENSEEIAHCVGEDVQIVYRSLSEEMARRVRQVGDEITSILQQGS